MKNISINKHFINALILAMVGMFVIGVPAAMAISFNPSNIISNTEFFNKNSLTLKDIQYFLKQKGGMLSSYSVSVNGVRKSASKIIYDAAQEYSLSPKTILVTLQKEQSLVTAKDPSQRAINFAMGYGCPDGGSCNPNASGFYKQVDFASWQFRRYTDHPGWYTYKVANTYNISGTSVKIQNQATANLYNYTPHIHGNENFWRIWNSWFIILYPDGSLLKPEGEPGIWLIKDGKKYPFHSAEAFHTKYDINKVIEIPASVLDAYPLGTPIKYSDLTLLQAPSGGVYLVLNGEKYAVTSREIFNNLGLNPEEMLKVGWTELNNYPDGGKITNVTSAPSGRLLQSRQTGSIYYVTGDVLRTIHSPEILRSQFGGLRWVQVDQSELDSYQKGSAVKFRDGELIASPNSNGVYFVSNGKKLPIPSMEVFLGLGFKWSNIVWTSDRAVSVHPTGDKLRLFR
ncbi:hypothetical protein ACFL04_03875 [Patescibacteria group bacterium]